MDVAGVSTSSNTCGRLITFGILVSFALDASGMLAAFVSPGKNMDLLKVCAPSIRVVQSRLSAFVDRRFAQRSQTSREVIMFAHCA